MLVRQFLMKQFPYIILLIICTLLCAVSMSAQYRLDSWTTDDGLPQNGVRAIAQQPNGYLWFTTFDGLVRFDGIKFTVFDKNNSKGIVSNRFSVVKAFADGSLWTATEEGDLTIYRDRIFTSYRAETVPDRQIYGFYSDTDGEILINTENAFYKLLNDEFIFVKKDQNDGTEKQTHFGRSGARWEMYADKTLRIKDGATQVYPLASTNLYYYNANVFEDEAGGLWIGDFAKLSYLSVDGKVTEYGVEDGYPKGGYAHRIWKDEDGSLWFATGRFQFPGVGLVRFKDGEFKIFGAESGLSDNHIFDIFKDREGTVWLATDKGLNRLRRQIITQLSKNDGLVKNEVYPILRARDGSIYVGMTNGLFRYRDGQFSEIELSFDNIVKVAPSVQSLGEDSEGRLWVGVLDGLFVVENGKARRLDRTLDYGGTVSVIHTDRYGSVWFGTSDDGVLQFRDGKISSAFTVKDGLASNNVKAIYEAKDGKLWFGTYGGLSSAECGEGNVNCRIKSYTTADGLASNSVRSVYEDADGVFWIGTYDGGLSRFKDGKFFNFNTGNGLSTNGVFATVEDGNGNFWMSSNKGIHRVNKQSLNDFADGKKDYYESLAYGKQDGMLSTECNGGRQPSAMKTEDGKIWFPTLEGVAIVDTNALKKNPLPPPVEIENVSVDRQKVNFNETVILNPSNNYLDINYTALSFIKSDQIPFRYKLEGLDKDWFDAGTRRTVNYTHLPPGEYTFTVIAANSDGVWNTEGKSFKIVVNAPFYKTWRFWTAVLLILGFAGFLIYKMRVRQLQKVNVAQEAFARQLIESQEAERKRIAQELHDGLGQNLLVIKNRALLGLAVEKKDEQFDEIRDSVTDALSEVRSISYNLRPLHLERLGLTSTLEEMIEEIEETSKITINCDIAPIDDLLTPENEINFYRIVQECLNNIVKHSKAKRASVEIYRENEHISLTVKDDGRGFETETAGEKRGLGLNGIAERVKILRGSLSINSTHGNGTTVSVTVQTDISV